MKPGQRIQHLRVRARKNRLPETDGGIPQGQRALRHRADIGLHLRKVQPGQVSFEEGLPKEEHVAKDERGDYEEAQAGDGSGRIQ